MEAAGSNTGRRTQQQRSANTREAVNDATISCLVTDGYAGTTLAAVTAAAGVSRGALTHQFGTKQEMVFAAVDDMAARHERELQRIAVDLPEGDGRAGAVLSVLWAIFETDLYYATLELWAAARTDAELRVPLLNVERETGRRQRGVLADAFGPLIAGHANFGVALDVTFNLMRGMALTGILRDDTARQHQLIDEWTAVFEHMTSDPAQNPQEAAK